MARIRKKWLHPFYGLRWTLPFCKRTRLQCILSKSTQVSFFPEQLHPHKILLRYSVGLCRSLEIIQKRCSSVCRSGFPWDSAVAPCFKELQRGATFSCKIIPKASQHFYYSAFYAIQYIYNSRAQIHNFIVMGTSLIPDFNTSLSHSGPAIRTEAFPSVSIKQLSLTSEY